MNSPEISYGKRVAELAEQRPSDLAVRFILLDGQEPAFTWQELHDRSSQLAAALSARGLALGERVALNLRNGPEFLLGAIAAWKLGAIPVPMRWDLPDWELTRLREVIDPKVELSGDDTEWIAATASDPVPDLPDAVSPQRYGICSSGSTGTPKVILPGAPGMYKPGMTGPFAALWQPIPRPETIMVPAPLYHTNGFSTFLNLLAGDHLVILEKFDATRIVDIIERHRISTFTATPTMLKRIADVPGVDERDLSSLEFILQGAAPMPPTLMHRWIELIGAERMFMAYGMTEGFGLTAQRGDEWLAHEGSVGRPFMGTELRILDDEGKELPPGEIGTVYLKSSMGGTYTYLGKAPRAAATDDGFQSAGDMGFLDEDGYLYIKDRATDLILTGGANVFPAEVEAALIDHPKIVDVVVIGLRDPEWGRRVHAVLEAADPGDPPTAEEVIAYAKGRLAAYKVPKTVEVVDAIPRSAATKVSRKAMIETRGG